VIRAPETAIHRGGGLAVLRGNLAPRGALLKRSAASPDLLRHEGPAVVFDGLEDMATRLDSDALDVTERSVLVLRHAGPIGAPGMPEAGAIPIPAKLARQGVRDMLRISDARMSGTAFGTIVLHVTPEAAAGGPLGRLRTGDLIRLDAAARRLDVLASERELEARAANATPLARPVGAERGYLKLFLDQVLQADEGCDFAFCRPPAR
jgi:dihydroxy-acid dehydratase